MKRIFADLSDDLIKKVKIECIEKSITQKDFMEKLINQYFNPPKAQVTKKTPAKATAKK